VPGGGVGGAGAGGGGSVGAGAGAAAARVGTAGLSRCVRTISARSTPTARARRRLAAAAAVLSKSAAIASCIPRRPGAWYTSALSCAVGRRNSAGGRCSPQRRSARIRSMYAPKAFKPSAAQLFACHVPSFTRTSRSAKWPLRVEPSQNGRPQHASPMSRVGPRGGPAALGAVLGACTTFADRQYAASVQPTRAP
jgi:hypothetical protein